MLKKYKYGINGAEWHLIAPDGTHKFIFCLKNWLRNEGYEFFGDDSKAYYRLFYVKQKAKKGVDSSYKGWRVVPDADADSAKKPLSPKRQIEIEKEYGGLKVIKQKTSVPKKYICSCLKCGKLTEMGTQEILQNRQGCAECFVKERSAKFEAQAKSHVGETHGTLTILDVFMKHRQNPKLTIWGCRCKCECGFIADYILSDVLAEFVLCKLCKKTKGVQRTRNNITKRGKKYYVRISFVALGKKTFYLGSYGSMDKAEKIRDIAEEKKKNGDFLEWYEKTFPQYWRKISKKQS